MYSLTHLNINDFIRSIFYLKKKVFERNEMDRNFKILVEGGGDMAYITLSV